MLPPIVAAVAYARLWRYSRDRAQRRRILATAASLILLLAPNLVAWRSGSWAWWFPVEKLLGLAAGLGMIATVWAARREDDERLADGRRAGALAEAEALHRRMTDLI
jgi:peptidoglycan/LPS O-acetylase OafA/YrhL